jgi:hypothetical protein
VSRREVFSVSRFTVGYGRIASGAWKNVGTRRQGECVVTNYHGNRGMDYYHDVHDWMGGWPCESISPEEVEQHMQTLRFEPLRKFVL